MEEKLDIPQTPIIVIGGSSGSLDIVLKIVANVREKFSAALVIVLHRKTTSDSSLSELLTIRSVAPVKEVEDKDPIMAGNVYLAPSDYHLLFEKSQFFALDDSEKINYSRPSIDVTFESAAEAFGASVTGILLSGSNADGSEGLLAIHRKGGATIVQDPETAGFPYMPQQAIMNAPVDFQMRVEEMIEYINSK